MPPPAAEQLASRIFLGPALRAQPDRRLVRLVREGYEAAFEEIVRRYRRPLDRFAASIVGGRSEDVTEDAFSKALLALRGTEAEIELRPVAVRDRPQHGAQRPPRRATGDGAVGRGDPRRDGDQLNNLGEFKASDNPHNPDTNGNEDGEENAGTIASFDAESGKLVINLYGGETVTGMVTKQTEIECGCDHGEAGEEEAGASLEPSLEQRTLRSGQRKRRPPRA